MSLVDDIKAKADANGDGKLSVEDLEALKNDHPEVSKHLSKLQSKADQNGDGKVDFADAKDVVGDISNNFGNMLKQK